MQPDLEVIDPEAPKNQRKSIVDNHTWKIRDVYFIEGQMTVSLDIVFRNTKSDPLRNLKTHTVDVPLKTIEGNGILNFLRENIRGMAVFIKNPKKYTKLLAAEIQFFTENHDLNPTNYEIINLSKPGLVKHKNEVFFICGEIWKLGSRLHKLSPVEKKNLPFKVIYDGDEIKYEDNEREAVKGILEVIRLMNNMQPNPEDHGWPVISLSRHFQGKLFTILIDEYPQATTIVGSGDYTRVGKSLFGCCLNNITSGVGKMCGKFSESKVMDKLIEGVDVVVDDIVELDKTTLNGISSVIQHQFNGLEKTQGNTCGFPKATMTLHCNFTKEDFKFSAADESKVVFINAGKTGLGKVAGSNEKPKDSQKKMVELAKSLHVFYPNYLNIALECYGNGITDAQMEELEDVVGCDDRKGQEIQNFKNFAYKLQDLSQAYSLDLPSILSRDPDITAMISVNGGNNENESASKEDLVKWIIEKDSTDSCQFGRHSGKEGVRIPSEIFNGAPPAIVKASKECASQPWKGKRWRFISEDDISQDSLNKIHVGSLSLCKAFCAEWNEAMNGVKDQIFESLRDYSSKVIESENAIETDPTQFGHKTPELDNSEENFEDEVAAKSFPCKEWSKKCKTKIGLKMHSKVHDPNYISKRNQQKQEKVRALSSLE